MKFAIVSIFCSLVISGTNLFGAAHTPQPGSEERKEICDALRDFVIHRVATRPLPQPIVFKISFLRVDGDIAWFEGIPVFKSGAFATDYLPDVAYAMVLRRTGGRWRVVHDLSRSDVPGESELTNLRKELAGIPASVIPDEWRRLLKR